MSAADPTGLLKRSDLENEYQVEIKQNIDRFGEVLVLKNAEGHRIMAKEKRPSTLEDCKRDVHQAFERLKLNHPHLLRMYDYSVMREDDHYVIRGYYELADANLAIELEQRKEAKAYFAAEELRNLLVDILEIVTYLKEKKMIHGDIRPEYVMFDGESQIYKLADRLGDPSPPTKVQAKNIIRGRKLYLSPQLFFNLVHQTRCTPNFEAVRLNPYLSEGYSIGLLILEAALLEDCQCIYDLELGQIDEGTLQERMAAFAENYQDQDVGLVRAVQDLLETSEEERPDLHLLLTGLKSTPQNSECEEEPENLIFQSDRDKRGDIIEEVEEEDDQSTQQQAIQSSFRQTKVASDEVIFKEDQLMRTGKMSGGSPNQEKFQMDPKTRTISEFTSLSMNVIPQKEPSKVEEKPHIAPHIPPIKADTLAESGFDLILKEEVRQPHSKSDSFGFEPIKPIISKENIDPKAKTTNLTAKESKLDSKNETKTNSTSQEMQSDGHSSLKQSSKEEIIASKISEINKQTIASSRQTEDTSVKESSKPEDPALKQPSHRLQPSKLEEEQDWERNLAEIKFQRDEVLQGLQSLKNIHQDFYKSEEAQQQAESKHVPNIFKDEFSSGQSLHQLTPNQQLVNKVEYDSNTLIHPKSKDQAAPELKRESDSNPQLSTNLTSVIMSKASSGNQLTHQSGEAGVKEDYVRKSKFDYNLDHYMFKADLRYQEENKENMTHSSLGQKAPHIAEVDQPKPVEPAKIFTRPEQRKLDWDQTDDLMVTPKRQETIAAKQGTLPEQFRPQAPVQAAERTPQQQPNQKTFDHSTQFKAYEQTPLAEIERPQGSRAVIEGIKKTTPFTALKPGDVLINSNNKIVPQAEFSSAISKLDNRNDSTPVRELAQPSGNTEARELSSFIASASYDASERRLPQPAFYKDGQSPLQPRFDPNVALNFKKDTFVGSQNFSLTPSASQASLHVAQMPPIPQTREQVITKPAEIKFKPAEQTFTYREASINTNHIHTTHIGQTVQNVSPHPQPALTPLPPLGRAHNPIVVLSQSRVEDLKPIVIRSRSTTPIKNTMQSLASMSESFATTSGQQSLQPNSMRSTLIGARFQPEQNTSQPNQAKTRELESLFQTGPSAPAYKGFPAPVGKAYYETVSPPLGSEHQLFRPLAQSYTLGMPPQPLKTSTYTSNSSSMQRLPTAISTSTYIPAQPQHQTPPNTTPQSRSVSPLQSSIFRKPQDTLYVENQPQITYGSVFNSSVPYGSTSVFHSTHNPSHHGVMTQSQTSQTRVVHSQFVGQDSRSKSPIGQPQMTYSRVAPPDSSNGYMLAARQLPSHPY
jgi:serine/threonine protein kinase